MSSFKPTYVQIALATLRDLGTIDRAANYCDHIAAQNGEDAVSYQLAAESLRDAKTIKVQS